MNDNIKLYFNLLKQFNVGCEYYPDPLKSVLTVHPDNPETGKIFMLCHQFKFCTGARYLGNFICSNKSKHDWPQYFTMKW